MALPNPSGLSLLQNKIPPPFLVVFIGLVMWAVSLLAPIFAMARDLRLGLAGLLGIIGVILLASGLLAFRRARTTIDPVRIEAASCVVTSGIFAYTRNPMYIGFVALLLAWTVDLASPWTLVGPIFFVLFIDRFQIVPEERAMSKKFGSDYDAYCRRVRRWF